jgi:hypothetical protein
MADHLRAELPLAALRMAISVQRPGSGLIHHSDRGVQSGFNRSSQHSSKRGCDEEIQAFGSVCAGSVEIARPPFGGAAREL